jgi:hypothetical protein
MLVKKRVVVSLDEEDVAWLRKTAREQQTSVSAVLGEAIRLMRQTAARRSVLDRLGGVASLTPKRIREIEREWYGR